MPPQSLSQKNPIIAVDTGGTFTDFFMMDPEGIKTHKVFSTPSDPSRAILQGLRELNLKGPFEVIHGSTVATNAFLERKGSRVVLVTTAGFEDVLEIGRQNRPQLYHFLTRRTPVLVPSQRRFGVKERITAGGKILTALTPGEIQKLKKKLKKSRYDSISVCLLFSYANPKHERLLKEHLSSLKKFLSISSEICPEYREYERTSTTCINAYVAPIMSFYLKRLKRKLKRRIRILQSNGGSLSVEKASSDAIHTLLSGPAGGVLGAFQIGRKAGFHKILSLDMGGTSTDMSLIDGAIELTTEAYLGGLPIKTPMIRIDTIGAGGGSLAWIDHGGALQVGPKSAGADPGPICYGRGGSRLTLTDAHVYLGRLPPSHFLGGKIPLYPEKIQKPLQVLAKKLGLNPQETAEGVITVANANMEKALRVLSLERGFDPRDFILLPFGGAGALHACELASLLNIPRVLVPGNPGILSAFGMAHADWVRDYVKTVLWTGNRATGSRLAKGFALLKQRAIREAKQDGFSADALHFQNLLDVRYRGQSYELTVKATASFKNSFEKAHQRQYGFLHQGHELEVVNLRLQARVPLGGPKLGTSGPRRRKTSLPSLGRVKLYWKGKIHSAPIWKRESFAAGNQISGPGIIVEYSATTFLPRGWNAECDRHFNLILTPKG